MHQAVNCISAGVLLAAGASGGNLGPYDVRCDSLWYAQSLGCLKHSAVAIRLGRNACNDHVAELIPQLEIILSALPPPPSTEQGPA